MSVHHDLCSTPLGDLLVVVDGDAVVRVGLLGQAHLPDASTFGARRRGAGAAVLDQLEAYLAGERQNFDLALAAHGTAFQTSVWAALAEIPYGSTTTYAELAERVGRPGATRAVGSAVGRNPHLIVVPCHRVLRSDGTLGGYAAGLATKERLLRLEGVLA